MRHEERRSRASVTTSKTSSRSWPVVRRCLSNAHSDQKRRIFIASSTESFLDGPFSEDVLLASLPDAISLPGLTARVRANLHRLAALR